MAEKITKYVNTFIDYIKERNMENNIAADLLDNKVKIKEFNRKIEKISDELKNLKTSEDISKKINELQNTNSDIGQIERNIEQNKKDKAWLEDLINKLINIIEL